MKFTCRKRNRSFVDKKEAKNNIFLNDYEPAAVLRYNLSSPSFICSFNSYKGNTRDYNEDKFLIRIGINETNVHFFGVFDGHGGSKCVEFVRDNLFLNLKENKYFPNQPVKALKKSFFKTESDFINKYKPSNLIDIFESSGSCALTVLVVDDTCYVSNVGDSRGIYSENTSLIVNQINYEHKPNHPKEKERIEAVGGKIYQNSDLNSFIKDKPKPWRIIPGKLSVSRAFGDIGAKLPELGGNSKVLIASPDIIAFKLNKASDFIILGCDGIFDCMTNSEVCEIVWRKRKISEENKKVRRDGLAKRICDDIIKEAMNKGSTDNLTCIFIGFRNFFKKYEMIYKSELGDQEKIDPLENIKSKNCNKIIKSIILSSEVNKKDKIENYLQYKINTHSRKNSNEAVNQTTPNPKKTSFENYIQQFKKNN